MRANLIANLNAIHASLSCATEQKPFQNESVLHAQTETFYNELDDAIKTLKAARESAHNNYLRISNTSICNKNAAHEQRPRNAHVAQNLYADRIYKKDTHQIGNTLAKNTRHIYSENTAHMRHAQKHSYIDGS